MNDSEHIERLEQVRTRRQAVADDPKHNNPSDDILSMVGDYARADVVGSVARLFSNARLFMEDT